MENSMIEYAIISALRNNGYVSNVANIEEVKLALPELQTEDYREYLDAVQHFVKSHDFSFNTEDAEFE